MRRPSSPSPTSNRAITGIQIAAAALFALVAFAVAEDPVGPEANLINLIGDSRGPEANALFLTLTHLGSVYFLAAATTLLGLWSLKQQPRMTLFLATAMVGSFLLSASLKLLVARPRPPVDRALATLSSYSFPSGHSTSSMTLALCIMVLVANGEAVPRVPNHDDQLDRQRQLDLRKWLIVVVAILTITVGFSRVYLGVHYPSDVFAGWCLATAWVLTLKRALRV